jgi:hypothetical protein
MNSVDIANNLINRAKNLKEFVVLREFDDIPTGVIEFDIKHTQGELARIFVHALTQEEAEQLVDKWFNKEFE